uniref:Tyrosine decarboxylase n=1 Tax=Panagrolaimus sp. JU765 TaxID=591449 RepID=A0AC34R2I8_9BILA
MLPNICGIKLGIFVLQLAELNLKTPQFLVLVADNVLEPCSPPSDTLTVAQILFHGAESLVSFKDKKRTFSTGKIRVKNQVAVEIFKGMIFDVLEDDFLSKLDLETYKSLAGSRFWKWLQIPTWLAIVLGAVGFYYAENALSNLEVKKVSSATELFLIRTDKKYRDKPRLPQSRNKTVPITPDDFRRWMRLITEVIVDYSDHPDVYDVTPNVKPGFLIQKMPGTAPENPGTIEGVIRDVYELILPGSTHWQHPRMHAYYAAGASYPDIIGEILASGFGSVNFSWDSGPSMTELEIVMVNWAGKAFGLPESFLYQTDGDVTRSKGGGAIQSGASDAIFIALLAARFRAISESVSPKHAEKTEAECEALKNLVAYSSYEAHSSIEKAAKIALNLVAYSSYEAHSSIEKAAKIALVKLRSIKPKGEHLSLKGSQLETEITKDLERGLKPFFVHVTLGTTATCAFDDLKEITQVAKKYNLWVHVDAAYAGSAFVCPEFRYLMDGIEDADSININLHKMFMLTTPSSILWTKNQEYVIKAMTVNPTYLKQHDGAMDFRHWSVLLSRRSNCFKIWCLMKLYGIRAMQDYVRRVSAEMES